MTPRKIRGAAERMRGYACVQEARDPGVAAERLREFAGDDIMPVRLYTAQSLAAPSDVLLRLARDEEACVRSSVLLNPAADDPVLRALAEAERAASPRRFWRRPDFSVRRLVVHHPGPRRRCAPSSSPRAPAAAPASATPWRPGSSGWSG